MERGNFLAPIDPDPRREILEDVLVRPGVRIERIVSLGQASPPDFWYDQEEHEWVLVLTGRARLEIEGEAAALELEAGDFVDIPAHRRHRVAWTSPDEPTVWLAVFYSPQATPSEAGAGVY